MKNLVAVSMLRCIKIPDHDCRIAYCLFLPFTIFFFFAFVYSVVLLFVIGKCIAVMSS